LYALTSARDLIACGAVDGLVARGDQIKPAKTRSGADTLGVDAADVTPPFKSIAAPAT
jgi:hypothetical protein